MINKSVSICRCAVRDKSDGEVYSANKNKFTTAMNSHEGRKEANGIKYG